MKWNIMVGTLVLGLGLSTQSFGFDLLDRMLGAGDCGCEPKCCTKRKAGCADKNAAKGDCAAKGKDDCKKRCRTPLLPLKRCCSDSKAKDCAAKNAKKADCGCAAKKADKGCSAKKAKKTCKRRCLLDSLFSCHKNRCNSGCAKKKSCGCDGKAAKGDSGKNAKGDATPMPPAPVVDPSAFLPRQRQVINVSSIR